MIHFITFAVALWKTECTALPFSEKPVTIMNGGVATTWRNPVEVILYTKSDCDDLSRVYKDYLFHGEIIQLPYGGQLYYKLTNKLNDEQAISITITKEKK